MPGPHRYLNPRAAPPPFSPYSQAVDSPAGLRWLHISGQVGVTPQGQLAEGAEGQMRQSWANILAILADAEMGPEDLVKVTGFLTRSEDTGLYRVVRDDLLDGAQPASTLLIVSGLASSEWLVEIEAIAAK